MAPIGYEEDSAWVQDHMDEVWKCLDELKQARRTISYLEDELECN